MGIVYSTGTDKLALKLSKIDIGSVIPLMVAEINELDKNGASCTQ
jgi:hypothetical protein